MQRRRQACLGAHQKLVDRFAVWRVGSPVQIARRAADQIAKRTFAQQRLGQRFDAQRRRNDPGRLPGPLHRAGDNALGATATEQVGNLMRLLDTGFIQFDASVLQDALEITGGFPVADKNETPCWQDQGAFGRLALQYTQTVAPGTRRESGGTRLIGGIST